MHISFLFEGGNKDIQNYSLSKKSKLTLVSWIFLDTIELLISWFLPFHEVQQVHMLYLEMPYDQFMYDLIFHNILLLPTHV